MKFPPKKVEKFQFSGNSINICAKFEWKLDIGKQHISLIQIEHLKTHWTSFQM